MGKVTTVAPERQHCEMLPAKERRKSEFGR